MNGSTLTLGLVAGLAAAGALSPRGSRAEGERWFHLTDKGKFKLDPKHAPADNSLSIADRSGRPGIYLAPADKVEHWLNGSHYWRPFVVEFDVDPSVFSDPGVHGRWGGERFIPAASFGKLSVRRVIPLDAFSREHFGDAGWIEEWEGRSFDAGEPLPPGYGRRFKGYHYDGPDVRDMPKEQISRHKRRLRAFRKDTGR